jgi:hypothetical protein
MKMRHREIATEVGPLTIEVQELDQGYVAVLRPEDEKRIRLAADPKSEVPQSEEEAVLQLQRRIAAGAETGA